MTANRVTNIEKLLRRKEVAEILGKPISWLRYSERKRIIPFVKVGQQIRYRASDLEAWIQSHRVEEDNG